MTNTAPEHHGMANASPLGLVLSGGGAKGAYQAGVWKALVEMGFAERITAISGTSVGAINATAFASIRDPDQIRAIWHDRISSVVSPNFKAFSTIEVLTAIEQWLEGKQFPLHGILDRDSVSEILSATIPEPWPADTPAVHATTLEARGASFGELDRSSYKKVRFRIDQETDPGIRIKKVLASCAIPWCYSPVEIDGKRYVDGGWDSMGGENIPVQPILKKHPGIRTLIVVRCNSRDLEPEEIRLSRHPDINLVEIRPSTPLPGIFDIQNLGGGILMGALFPGLSTGMIFKAALAAISGFFMTRQAKVWGATLAFSPVFTDQFFDAGYKDTLVALDQHRLNLLSNSNGNSTLVGRDRVHFITRK